MKGNLCLLTLALLLLGTGCFGGGNGGSPDVAEVRRQVAANLNQISIALSEENVFAASEYVSDQFVLQPEVAARFEVGPFEGMGKQAFREFFERVIEKYGNVSLTFTNINTTVEDRVATARARVEFSGNNINAVPPFEVSFVETDLLVFEFDGDHYLLVNWGEDEHTQGQGGSV
jgi:hypothetical protein